MRQSGRVGPAGHESDEGADAFGPREERSTIGAGGWSRHGIEVDETEVLGEKRLRFNHPCGIEYELVGVADDERTAHTAGPVPQELGIHGTHGITVSVRDLDLSADFMTAGWSGRLTQEERRPGPLRSRRGWHRSRSWTSSPSPISTRPAGCTARASSTTPRSRWPTTTCRRPSRPTSRGSASPTSPSAKTAATSSPSTSGPRAGALFEATVSKPEGFLIDEPYRGARADFQVPPQFAGQRDFLISYLEPLEY